MVSAKAGVDNLQVLVLLVLATCFPRSRHFGRLFRSRLRENSHLVVAHFIAVSSCFLVFMLSCPNV